MSDASVRMKARAAGALLGAALALALAAAPAPADVTLSAPAGPAGTNFWDAVPPAPPATAKAGDILWAQPRADAPAGAQGWNVVYVSEIAKGVKQYVSGEIYAPSAPAEAPRDVVLWNHETTGLPDSCAPSRRSVVIDVPFPHTRVPAIEPLLAQGRVVVMSDYPGQGLAGKPYYMAGAPNARASLDLLRAARTLPELNTTSRFVQYGWSQGGQTSEHVEALVRGSAPGLQLLGTGLFAPAVRIRALTASSMADPGLAGYVVMTLRGVQAAHPSLKLRDFLTAEGMELLPALSDGCFDAFAAGAASKAPYRKAAMAERGSWSKALAAIDAFKPTGRTPFAIWQGDKDAAVPVSLTRRERTTLCATGARVQYSEIKGLDHTGVLGPAIGAFSGWAAERFAGAPAPSDCPGR